jgi:molybdopterin synthase catalytic subunit/molybdopterin converting factor small subunit
VKVLFFGMLKDVVGRAEDQLVLEDNATLGRVFDHYGSRFPRLREMAGSILLARNHEFAGPSTQLAEGDEIAFLPPVSGGSGSPLEISENGNFFALTWHPIVTRKIADRLLRGEDGAVVTFEGVVRNNTHGRQTHFLDYECYEPMALKMLAQIGRDIAAGYAIDRIALVHRLGRMLIGETSVVVIVTAAHRKAAFAAALEGIDRLKRVVPIWKKEHFADGEVWVEGEWDRNAAMAQGG